MHCHDIARAIGQPIRFEASDAEVVAHVVRDLQRAWHGPDLTLRLDGDAGGTWRLGAGDIHDEPAADVDAVEFLRHLSGRDADPHLFGQVPAIMRTALGDARVTF